MTDFRMPSLGADMDEGTLVQWLKAPGDRLSRGDIVAVVETQKGAIEIEVFSEGLLEEIRVKPGMKVPVGEVLAIIRTEGEAVSAAGVSQRPEPVIKPAATPVVMPPAPVEAGLRVTPAARQRVKALAIDFSAIAPGSDGVIGLRELEKEAKLAPPKPVAGINLDEMRKAIAAAMARSKREIPHYYVSSAIDLTRALDWLSKENAGRAVPQRIIPAALIAKACAKALVQCPSLNGHFLNGSFRPQTEIKMGIGISLRGGGLIAPALSGPDKLSLDDLMRRLRDLVARVRGGRLRSSELTDATVTLSNLGDDSADLVLPVIYPPQVAIIGVGQASDRPWVVEGSVAIRKIATFAVAGDHRANDGRAAARFLKTVEEVLQKPEEL
jgi:pyruvate dehydrogenase E2 component (dihydrolipoamide acetyltransferase)